MYVTLVTYITILRMTPYRKKHEYLMIFNLTCVDKASLRPVVLQTAMVGQGFGDTWCAEITLPQNKITKYYETM